MTPALIVGLVCAVAALFVVGLIAVGVMRAGSLQAQPRTLAEALGFPALPPAPGQAFPWYAGNWGGRPAALGIASARVERPVETAPRRRKYVDLRVVLALRDLTLDEAVRFQRNPFRWNRGGGVSADTGTLPPEVREALMAHAAARGSIGLVTRPGPAQEFPGEAFAPGHGWFLFEDLPPTGTTPAQVREALVALGATADRLQPP